MLIAIPFKLGSLFSREAVYVKINADSRKSMLIQEGHVEQSGVTIGMRHCFNTTLVILDKQI